MNRGLPALAPRVSFRERCGGLSAVEWIGRHSGCSSMAKRAFGSARPAIRAVLVSLRSERVQASPGAVLTKRGKEVRHGVPRIRREVPPGRTGRIALRREDTFRNSSIAAFRFEASCSLPAVEGARRQG